MTVSPQTPPTINSNAFPEQNRQISEKYNRLLWGTMMNDLMNNSQIMNQSYIMMYQRPPNNKSQKQIWPPRKKLFPNPTKHQGLVNNWSKRRRFNPKKKNNNRVAPYAPRNTTSFIIRAKKSGGIGSLVSPRTAVIPTPIFSPSREALSDMAKEEWGIDGYGSMKGLIRVQSNHEQDEEVGLCESDVEDCIEVERRLDRRFEMIYPMNHKNVLENRVDDHESHMAQMENENVVLKDRVLLMERELGDLKKRLFCLERKKIGNESEGGENVRLIEKSNEGVGEFDLKEVNESARNGLFVLKNM